MLNILGIETCFGGLSVCFLEEIDKHRVAICELRTSAEEYNTQAKNITNFIKEVTQGKPQNVQNIVVNASVGSFTGIRIGVSAALAFSTYGDTNIFYTSTPEILMFAKYGLINYIEVDDAVIKFIPQDSATRETVCTVPSIGSEVYLARVDLPSFNIAGNVKSLEEGSVEVANTVQKFTKYDIEEGLTAKNAVLMQYYKIQLGYSNAGKLDYVRNQEYKRV